MFLKILIATTILVAFTMLALGIKMLFDKDASFTGHSCSMEGGKSNEVSGCASCDIQELAHCADKKN